MLGEQLNLPNKSWCSLGIKDMLTSIVEPAYDLDLPLKDVAEGTKFIALVANDLASLKLIESEVFLVSLWKNRCQVSSVVCHLLCYLLLTLSNGTNVLFLSSDIDYTLIMLKNK